MATLLRSINNRANFPLKTRTAIGQQPPPITMGNRTIMGRINQQLQPQKLQPQPRFPRPDDGCLLNVNRLRNTVELYFDKSNQLRRNASNGCLKKTTVAVVAPNTCKNASSRSRRNRFNKRPLNGKKTLSDSICVNNNFVVHDESKASTQFAHQQLPPVIEDTKSEVAEQVDEQLIAVLSPSQLHSEPNVEQFYDCTVLDSDDIDVNSSTDTLLDTITNNSLSGRDIHVIFIIFS